MGCTRKHSNQAPHGSHERYATTNTPEQGRGPSGEGAARHRRVELYQRGIASVVGVSEHVHDSSRHCYSCGGRRIDRDADVVARPSWTSRTRGKPHAVAASGLSSHPRPPRRLVSRGARPLEPKVTPAGGGFALTKRRHKTPSGGPRLKFFRRAGSPVYARPPAGRNRARKARAGRSIRCKALDLLARQRGVSAAPRAPRGAATRHDGRAYPASQTRPRRRPPTPPSRSSWPRLPTRSGPHSSPPSRSSAPYS